MIHNNAHCMSDLRELPACCRRGMGSATVSHPEMADDKCSAALDIPKVASLFLTCARSDCHHTECPGKCAGHQLQGMLTAAFLQSNALVIVGHERLHVEAYRHQHQESARDGVLCAGGNDVSDPRGDSPGATVGAVVPAPGWTGACLSPEGESACDYDSNAWRPVSACVLRPRAHTH